MIKNLWNRVQFYCIHNHEVPVPFRVQEGPSSPFYACPKYFPDNREPDERPCGNRVNLIDAESIVMKLGDYIEESEMNGEVANFTNFCFDYKGIEVKVLKYTDSHIDLGIVNKKALK